MGWVALGGLLLLRYRDLPIVRNSLLYAKICYGAIEKGLATGTVEPTFNKALGFPLLSVPFVSVLGANVGLKVSSYLWTAAWLVSTVWILRRLGALSPQGGTSASGAVVVLALVFNPLVLHQFVSAYSDTLSALALVWSIYSLHRMLHRSARWADGLLFATSTLVAIWTKHHGFVVLAVLLVFVTCRWREVAWLWISRRNLLFSHLSFLVALAVVLLLAARGRIPFFNLRTAGGNYTREFDELTSIVVRNSGELAIYLLLSFSALVPFLFLWRGLGRRKEWYLTLAVLVSTVLVYHGAGHNIRYFLPAAPILAWIAGSNWSRAPRIWRLTSLGAFLLCNGLLTATYSHLGFHDFVSRVWSPWRVDNLRLVGEQKETLRDLQAINAQAESGDAMLFFVSDYYGSGMWHVWEREGLFDSRLWIHYMNRTRWESMATRMALRGKQWAVLYSIREDLVDGSRHGQLRLERLSWRTFRMTLEP